MQVERRIQTRAVQPGGLAHGMMTNGPTAAYAIQDASTSGVALRGLPAKRVGTTMELVLHWPGIGSAAATGVIRRIDEAHNCVGIEYLHARGVHSLIGRLLALQATRGNPLLCGRGALIDAAEQTLRDRGIEHQIARTPLEAIHAAQDALSPISTVAFLTTPSWLAVDALFAEELPWLRRVYLGSPMHSSSSDDEAGCIEWPWHPDGLLSVLGVEFSGETCWSCSRPLTVGSEDFCFTCRDRSRDLSRFDDLGVGD